VLQNGWCPFFFWGQDSGGGRKPPLGGRNKPSLWEGAPSASSFGLTRKRHTREVPLPSERHPPPVAPFSSSYCENKINPSPKKTPAKTCLLPIFYFLIYGFLGMSLAALRVGPLVSQETFSLSFARAYPPSGRKKVSPPLRIFSRRGLPFGGVPVPFMQVVSFFVGPQRN